MPSPSSDARISAFRNGTSFTICSIGVLDLLGPSTPGKLAECTGLTTGGVTVMLDRLEKAGFVKRERNPNDRRSVLVHVNPKRLQKMPAYYAEINASQRHRNSH
jgi:DNA-binding MarR family transcriptional regulator